MSGLDFSDPEIKAKHRAFVNYLYEKYYGRNAINDNESEVELPRKIKKREIKKREIKKREIKKREVKKPEVKKPEVKNKNNEKPLPKLNNINPPKKRGRPRKIENNATKTGLLNRGLLKGVKGVK